MKQSLIRRYLYLATSFLLAVYFISGSFFDDSNRPGFIVSRGLREGLDLKGGVHLTLEVDLEEALLHSAESQAGSWKSTLDSKGVKLEGDPVSAIEEGVTVIRFPFKSPEERDTARRLMEEQAPSLRLEVEDGAKKPTLLIRGEKANSLYVQETAVDRAMEILRKRVDAFGIAEAVLVREAENRIVIQLPGLDDEKKALKLLQGTAALEFKIVHDANDQMSSWVSAARQAGTLTGENPTEEDYSKALSTYIPTDAELGYSAFLSSQEYEGGKVVEQASVAPILLRPRTELSGEAVVDARFDRDQRTNEPQVAITLSAVAARTFEDLTARNVNKQLAIVLDGKVKSAPNILGRIGGGRVQITGMSSEDEARELALVLRSGALPASIKVIQNIKVGATLGEDSIRMGFLSSLLGFLAVVIFMGVYYRLSGIIADFALLLNNVLLLGCLAFFGATLTLPGIAGIALTMGMAVDSNILIFERIREELDLGRPIPPSIRAGFDKAFWTIIDSHVTTLITAFVLFEFGTGPIKGFAVTLSIGVVLNLFTALVGTKVVYDHLLMKSMIKHLKFLELIRRPSLDFISLRRPAFVLSGCFLLLALIAGIQVKRGNANLGIDFAGGTMITLSTGAPLDVGAAREVLEKSGFKDPVVQSAGRGDQLLIRLRETEVTTSTAGTPQGGLPKTALADDKMAGLIDRVVGAFQSAHSDHQFKVEGATMIGGSVSKDLRNTTFLAVLISLVGIIGYLTLRFDFRFGVAAAVATFHDVLTVFGFFWLANRQIDLLMVTGLLTLAGYSLTDTVVVFDRIRETRQRSPTLAIGDVVNKSINEVLSRTIITSSSVFLVLVCLFLFGGPVLHDFSLALLLGVIVGTYSSIFVASAILYEWEKHFGRLMPDGRVIAPAATTSATA